MQTRARAFLNSFPSADSTTFGSMRGSDFHITTDMARSLGSFGESGNGHRQRVRMALERILGPGLDEGGVATIAEYIPDDTWILGSPQWALKNPGMTFGGITGRAGVDIGITRVWNQFDGDDSLVIAVLDAGYNFRHPDMQGRWFVNRREAQGVVGFDDDNNGFVDDTAGWDFVQNDNLPLDHHGHGTEISGVLAGTFDNGIGIAGMLPRVRILPVRVLDAAGMGDLIAISAGVRYAVAMHADVINFSIGGGGDSPGMRSAFQLARDSGVLIAAAAGNDSVNLDQFPEAPTSYGFQNLYAVASHNHAGSISNFSNFGPNTVPIAAPGEWVLSAGIPQNILALGANFDTGAVWTYAAAGNFTVTATAPMQGTRMLQWSTGVNTWAMPAPIIDLTGKEGGIVIFMLDYRRANLNDMLIVEGLLEGTSQWLEIATINGTVSRQWLSFGLQAVQGRRFQLRFRTSGTSSASRIFRLDDVRIYVNNPNPPVVDPSDPVQYPVVNGTSIASPHMAGYLGLLKIACRRMGIPLTRSLALSAAVAETGYASKIGTGGRLDVSKGLAFYLNTLPHLSLTDSTDTVWNVGDSVRYLASVPGSSGTWDYSVLASSTLPGASMGPASGFFNWPSSGSNPVSLIGRFRANSTPLVFRSMQNFRLVPAVVPIRPTSKRENLMGWVGNHKFRRFNRSVDGRSLQTP